MEGRQSLCTACLHAVLRGLAALNYHIQFYGLFYEKLLFSLAWIAIKGNIERQERIYITLAKIVPPWSMVIAGDSPGSISQHFLRTFCGEAEASKTPELRGGRSKDTGVAITGHPGL